jgi:hypothetical protein
MVRAQRIRHIPADTGEKDIRGEMAPVNHLHGRKTRGLEEAGRIRQVPPMAGRTKPYLAKYAARMCGLSINSRPLPSIASEPDSNR